jgi:hypothetical protein
MGMARKASSVATTTVGKVWTFTVADYLIVDDFEAYTDVQGEAIFDTWIEGDQQSGSVARQPPFAERTIVFSGSQAMPRTTTTSTRPWYPRSKKSSVL